MLFRIDYYRIAFYKLNGVESLVNYLESSLNSTSSKDQMQYQVIFCIWLLTFNEEIASRVQNDYMLIPVLTDILNATEKEKVKRIILASFRVSFKLINLKPSSSWFQVDLGSLSFPFRLMKRLFHLEPFGEGEERGGGEGELSLHVAVQVEEAGRADSAESTRGSRDCRRSRVPRQEAWDNGAGRELIWRVHSRANLQPTQLDASAQIRQVLARERPETQREQFFPDPVSLYMESLFFRLATKLLKLLNNQKKTHRFAEEWEHTGPSARDRLERHRRVRSLLLAW